MEIVRSALTEPVHLIAANAGYDGDDVVKQVTALGVDEGFDALEGRFGNMVEMGIIDPLRVVRSALQNGASVAGLILTTNSLVAEEVTPWNKSLMTEFGPLDEGIPQPSPGLLDAAVHGPGPVDGLSRAARRAAGCSESGVGCTDRTERRFRSCGSAQSTVRMARTGGRGRRAAAA